MHIIKKQSCTQFLFPISWSNHFVSWGKCSPKKVASFLLSINSNSIHVIKKQSVSYKPFFWFVLSMNDFLPGCLFAVVVIKCFMIGMNVWWVYLAPQNISHAISVDTWQSSYIVLYYSQSLDSWSHHFVFWGKCPPPPPPHTHTKTKRQTFAAVGMCTWYFSLCGEIQSHVSHFVSAEIILHVHENNLISTLSKEPVPQDSRGLFDLSECSYQHTQQSTQK